MAQQVASLYADIGAKVDGFEKGSATVLSGLGKMAAQAILSAATVQKVGEAILFSIEQAAQAEMVDAQLAAVLRSTGEAAGMSKQELDDLATSLSNLTTYDDEAIKSSEALLLTFTNIGSNVFPQAQKAILDMSTALGTDLQSSTIQLGKALNDPVKGITALQRVGVSFTAEQKKMIGVLVESGQVLDAQKIILAELTKEFGGSAAAAADTYKGQIKQLNNEVADLGETIGSDLLPDLRIFVAEAKETVTWVNENYAAIKEWGGILLWIANPIVAAGDAIGDYRKELKYGKEETEDVIPPTEDATKATEEYALALMQAEERAKDEKEANEEMQKSYAGVIDSAIDITKRHKDQEQAQRDVLTAIAETRAEGEKLYPWEAEKIDENKKKLEELGNQYFENQEKFREAQEERLAMMAIEAIALSDGVEGFSQAEYERAKAILETQDIATAAAFEEQQAMTILSQAVADGRFPIEEWGRVLDTVMADGVISVGEVNAAIQAVPKENTVNFTITTTGAPPNLSMDTSPAPVGTRRSSGRRARGGRVEAGGMYDITEEGIPEILSFGGKQMLIMPNSGDGHVTPLGKSGGAATAGGVVVNILLDSATPDPERVAYNIKPAVERVLRELRVA